VAGERNAIVTKLDSRSGAALKAIRVGNGPAAIAAGYGGSWVANRDDGTVTRIDATDAVSDARCASAAAWSRSPRSRAIWVGRRPTAC
jgi:DNA-binding beta-propeller fold protein YncE